MEKEGEIKPATDRNGEKPIQQYIIYMMGFDGQPSSE
jgi:hypothetical protein